MDRKNKFYRGGVEFPPMFFISWLIFSWFLFIDILSISIIIFSILLYLHKKRAGKNTEKLALSIKIIICIIIVATIIAISAIGFIHFYIHIPVSIMGWQI
jgi:hypothetical protein